MIRFSFRLAPDWPALAWIARLTPGSREVLVFHGPRVETRDDWFGEIVWAGKFDQADFDQTDVVFGSGARIRHDQLVLVPAGSTVDRLQSINHRGHFFVSNSLACLLAQVGGNPEVTDRNHFERLGTIRRGIDDYERFISTSAGPARLTYFHNLHWNGEQLIEKEKPDTAAGGFADFDSYRRHLVQSLRALGENAQDQRRRFPMRLLGTVSAGYDSAACAVLAREAAGLADAITLARPDGTDAGQLIAARLGLSLTQFEREAWCNPAHSGEPPEAPFIAGDAKGEDVFLRSAQSALAGCLLLTGHHGGGMWQRYSRNCSPKLARGDRSGLALTEWRLSAGFVHCPVPYIGACHHPDIQRIGQSEQMSAWRTGNGYDRPIPRRIIEEAGVPRESFGWTKRAGSVLLFRSASPLSAPSAGDLNAWLNAHTNDFLRKGMLPPAQFRWLLRSWRRILLIGGISLAWIRTKLGRGNGGRLARLASRMVDLGQRDPVFDYAFPWAVDCVKRNYPIAPAQRQPIAAPPLEPIVAREPDQAVLAAQPG